MATQVGKLKTGDTEGRGSPLEMLGFFGRLAEHPKRWRGFLHEVRVEMRQVTWPTRREVFVTTWVVMVTVAFFGVFFFGVDSGVSWLVQRIIKLFAH
jgi:preprotein translocase subunit SecE